MKESMGRVILIAALSTVALSTNATAHIEETSIEWSLFTDQRLKEKLLIILEVVLIAIAFLAALMALALIFLLIVSKCKKRCSSRRALTRHRSQRLPHPSVLKMDI